MSFQSKYSGLAISFLARVTWSFLLISCFSYSETTKTLQVLNEASWQETFKALWISALRLVQRVNKSFYDNDQLYIYMYLLLCGFFT
jgi:hypothetical protein